MRMYWLTFGGAFAGAALGQIISRDPSWQPTALFACLALVCFFFTLRGLRWPFFEWKQAKLDLSDPTVFARAKRLTRLSVSCAAFSSFGFFLVGVIGAAPIWFVLGCAQLVVLLQTRNKLAELESDRTQVV